MPPPPEPRLTPEELDLLSAATAEFNRGAYFECHDLLEDLWSGLRGPSRDFFQGLIQSAVAFHHLGNGNAAGALSLCRRARQRLAPYPERYFGFDLAAWRGRLATLETALARGAGDDAPPPCWRWEPAATAG